MSEQPTNYDAIRDIVEPAFRDRRKRERREQFERVADHVNPLTPEQFQPIYQQLKDATDEERREWVDENS